MTRCRSDVRTVLLILLAGCTLFASPGCHTFDLRNPDVQQPPSPEAEPPREMSMMSLPAYRIEPPDILQIEMLKLVPLPPYRAEIYDVLQIQVAGALPDQPINDYFLIEAEGTINLGPAYSPPVRVAGMTLEEVRRTLDQHLRRVLSQPEVSVQLARAAGTQPVTGEYLVTPDGTINLRQYGSVPVAGLTVAEAKIALQKHLKQYFDSPDVSVNVVAYNSKRYYIITEGAGLGDNVVPVPITGNETVLDAISNVGGLSQLSSKQIWIARPAPGGFGCEQILPVDWDAIVQGGVTRTNYQILPDDRIFIAENEVIAATNWINKALTPLDRLLGVTSLGASTVRNTQTLGRNFNKNRR